MKRFACIVLVFASMAFTACDDKDARQYAQQLISVLDTYQQQVDKKITAEKNSYKELATAYENARQRNIEESLEAERVERAEGLATKIATADRAPRSSEILESLRSYTDHDFTISKDFLQIEADAQAQFLGDIEALEFESENIDDLRAALKELGKDKGQLKRIRDATRFVGDVKTHLDKLTCQDLDTELTSVNSRLKAVGDELTELNKQPEINKEKIRVKVQERNELNARKLALQTEKQNKCS
jgi:hypothetical protein